MICDNFIDKYDRNAIGFLTGEFKRNKAVFRIIPASLRFEKKSPVRSASAPLCFFAHAESLMYMTCLFWLCLDDELLQISFNSALFELYDEAREQAQIYKKNIYEQSSVNTHIISISLYVTYINRSAYDVIMPTP